MDEIERIKEIACFVPTGRPCITGDFRGCGPGDGFVQAINSEDAGVRAGWPGYRRLPPGWTAEAVERIKALMAKAKGSLSMEEFLAISTSDAILAALFPPPEPEPEPWMREAARTWNRGVAARSSLNDREYEALLALHIAKHAGGAK